MKRLIYRSQPFGFDHAMLAGILLSARRNNRRDDITGALICRQDVYLQLIEGPPDRIDTLYAKIERDDRHCDVRLMLTEDASERMFAGWDMLDDEAPTLFWSPAEIAAGALDAASPVNLRGAFDRIRERSPGPAA